jgi:aldehyde dehydrogenase (NAD+)
MTTTVRIDQHQLFIDGEFRPAGSGAQFETVNPADGTLITTVARAGEQDVDEAVRSARDARRKWRNATPTDRGRLLLAIAAQLRAESEALALIECLDNGKPISQARFDIEYSARYFEYYGGLADKLDGYVIPLGSDYHSYTTLEPFGVVALITPWNAPLMQAARGLAPALATGNTCVVKPAEDTPLTILEFARIARECGIPAGVINVIPGFGEDAGAALVRHPLVDRIAFTGSVETGRIIARMAADRLAPVSVELGGKSANIVFEDVDVDVAAFNALRAINLNCGQNCSAGSRLLVHSSIHDAVLDSMVALERGLTVGPGLEDPDVGPLTTRDQYQRVCDYLRIGREEGAEAISGGSALVDERLNGGNFVQPTIFAGVTPQMRIAREEIFGPVLCVLPFDDDDEAVAIANDTDFGLVAGIWTNDFSRVHRVSAALEVGQVYINEYFAGGVETPFGGVKDSGYGREKGLAALEHYTRMKTMVARV